MHPWLIDGRRVADGYWNSKENRVEYLKWLEDKLDFSEPDDWYSISHSDFVENKGDSIYRHVYNQDRLAIVTELYPTIDWKPWLFKRMPIRTWDDEKNIRKYFDWISEQEGFQQLEDWYGMKRKDFEKYPGGTIINNKFGGSPRTAIMNTYPEYNWKEWLFVHSPAGFWNDDSNCIQYLDWLKSKLGIKSMEDWYALDQIRLQRYNGAGMHRRFSGSPEAMLRYFFPDFEWNTELFNNIGKNEALVLRYAREIFPESEVLSQFKHDKVRSSKTNQKLEFDVWIPKHKIAIEYQGEQHYSESWTGIMGQKEFEKIKQRDIDKKKACKTLDICLIEVPYTWDQSKEYLLSLLNHD